ncbi:uncharacterized protein [Osmerus mordax]|uniref:uncharacterized protein n=1 Tax=Osmerus mordax TaxID=8014 RepID=UPI00350F47F9
MCEGFPGRRVELDTYLAIIADLSLSYGGTLFYEYHKGFSAKAALYVQRFNLRLDWSVLDLELVSRTFTGVRPLSCVVVGLSPILLGFALSRCLLQWGNLPSVLGRPSEVDLPTSVPTGGQGHEINNHPSTPVDIGRLSDALSGHPNRCFVKYLLTGLRKGFMVGVECVPTVTHVCNNLQSALREPDVVDALLAKEIGKGYLLGPFVESPFPVFRVSPIGVATRKYSGKKRLIVDLSAPHDTRVPSINSLIPSEPFSLYYTSIDHAIRLIKQAGVGAWLGKADITDAFKVMPLHPSQWHLFGVRWRSQMYFYARLAFGCRSSPRIFDTLAEALCWVLLNVHRLPFVLHLLDDFLVVDFPSSPPARCISVVKGTFEHLGVPLSEEKTQGPLTSIEFMGVQLDSLLMRASLLAEKLERLRAVLAAAAASVSLTKRDLLSLLGHLNFAMRIIPHGRSFVSRLLVMAKSVPALHDVVRLDEGCQSDLRFWAVLCEHWNGLSFFYNDEVETSSALALYTDAALSVGFFFFFANEWFSESWPVELEFLARDCKSTALYELYPIVVACLLWGKHWCRKRIVVFCDNEGTVNIINKGRSSVALINKLVRRLTWTCITGNFVLRAAYIPGLLNNVADALSRFQFQEFRALCPEAEPGGLVCPAFQETLLD